MTISIKSIGLAVGLLALSIGGAAAFPAQVGPASNLRTGPGLEFPIYLTVPEGSVVDVEECSDEWCLVHWLDYEGFIYRPLLVWAGGVTVPYVAVFPDYYYQHYSYSYGPSIVIHQHRGRDHRHYGRRIEHRKPPKHKPDYPHYARPGRHDAHERGVERPRHYESRQRQIARPRELRRQHVERPNVQRPNVQRYRQHAQPRREFHQRQSARREVRPHRQVQRPQFHMQQRRSEGPRNHGGRGRRGG